MPNGSVEWKIDGLRELNQKLQQLPAKVQRNALRQAVSAGGRVIRDEARSRVHDAPHWDKSATLGLTRTQPGGLLRKAIRYTVSVKQSIGQAVAKVFVSAKTAWWGGMVERGTLPHIIAGGRLAASRNYFVRRSVFGSPHKKANRFQTRTQAKQAQALNVLGNFVAKVDHPGARPKPFMKPALDARYNDAVNAMAAKLRSFFDNFS